LPQIKRTSPPHLDYNPMRVPCLYHFQIPRISSCCAKPPHAQFSLPRQQRNEPAAQKMCNPPSPAGPPGRSGHIVSWTIQTQLNNSFMQYEEEDECRHGGDSLRIDRLQLLRRPGTTTFSSPGSNCSDRISSFTTTLSAGDGNNFKFAMAGDMGTMGPVPSHLPLVLVGRALRLCRSRGE
jgi:hypothetical protein